jgi:urease accessory protein
LIQPLHLTALLQLASPQLPVGGFSYSQGLEAAIHAGMVHDAASAEQWIADHFCGAFATWELPMLCAMHAACEKNDVAALQALNLDFIASRESRELRAETLQMGWSLRGLMAALLQTVPLSLDTLRQWPRVSYPAAFACAAQALGLDAAHTATGYAFSWFENQVAAALKAMPLGQVAGQKILLAAHRLVDEGVAQALVMPRDDRSSFAPRLAVLSARHESQYSRLFRS